jgi:FlaA1/EpsC-like NDP-sugar epimerase
MKTRLLRRNFLVILGSDALLLAVVWYGAHLLRFNFDIPASNLSVMKKAFPLLIAVKIATFYFFDLYRGMWRYTSITDLLNIIKATSISSLLIISLFSSSIGA